MNSPTGLRAEVPAPLRDEQRDARPHCGLRRPVIRGVMKQPRHLVVVGVGELVDGGEDTVETVRSTLLHLLELDDRIPCDAFVLRGRQRREQHCEISEISGALALGERSQLLRSFSAAISTGSIVSTSNGS